MKPTRELFMKAAEIAKERWGQGDYITDGGNCCMIGAVGLASGHSNGYPSREEYEAVCGSRAMRYKIRLWGSPEDWNDAPSRKKSEVVRVLKEIAMELPSMKARKSLKILRKV